MTESFDELQGYIRAEEQLKNITDLLAPRHRLRPGLRNAVPYTDADGRPTKLVNVEVNYLLIDTGVDADADPADRMAANTEVFRQVEEWWTEHDYLIVTRTVDQPYRVLRVRDRRDDFTVALKQGARGNLWLTASSAPVTRTRITPPPPALA